MTDAVTRAVFRFFGVHHAYHRVSNLPAGQGHWFQMAAGFVRLALPRRTAPGVLPVPCRSGPLLACRAGQPAQAGTIWYPAARMPAMMAGRAATVCERLPPPSCKITMAPGCRAASTRRVITAAPGLR